MSVKNLECVRTSRTSNRGFKKNVSIHVVNVFGRLMLEENHHHLFHQWLVWTNSHLRSPLVTAPLWPSARTGAATSAVTTGVAAGAADLGVSFTENNVPKRSLIFHDASCGMMHFIFWEYRNTCTHTCIYIIGTYDRCYTLSTRLLNHIHGTIKSLVLDDLAGSLQPATWTSK